MKTDCKKVVRDYFTGLKEEQNVKTRNWAGWIITGFNLLMMINSSYFFLFRMRTGIIGWIMLNTCAAAIIGFSVGYFLSSPVTMMTFSVVMFRYGTLGLFAFRWTGPNLFAQAGHIAMTLGIGYVLFVMLREKTFRTLAAGLVLGVVISLVFWYGFQLPWYSSHPGMMEMLFQGSTVPGNLK